MVRIETERKGDDKVACSAVIEGKGEDILHESYYALKSLFMALANNDEKLKEILLSMMIADTEWLGDESYGERSLNDILGRMAMERSVN